jgi:hypothetical protein
MPLFFKPPTITRLEKVVRYEPLIRFAVALVLAVGVSTTLLAQQPEKGAPPAANNVQPPPGGVTRPEPLQLSAKIFLATVVPVSKEMQDVLVLLLGWEGIIIIVVVLVILIVFEAALKRPRPIPEKVFRRMPAPAPGTPPTVDPVLAEVARLQDAPAPESMDGLAERELIDRLGVPVRTFVPSRTVKIVGQILVFLAGLVGVLTGSALVVCCLRFWTRQGRPAEYLVAVVGLVFSAAMIGIAVLGYQRLSAAFHPSNRILVCPGGIIRIEQNVMFAIRWERIHMARLWDRVIFPSFPGQNARYKETLTVTRDDGREMKITGTHARDLDELFELIKSYSVPKTGAPSA